jgi:hypothetical protein
MINNPYLILLIIIPLVFLFFMLFVSAVYQIKSVNKMLRNKEYLEMLSQKDVLLKLRPIAMNKIQPWIFGYILILVGVFCLASNWTTSDFWGIFLTIIGYQTTFWAIGIRSIFLGNDFEDNKTKMERN